MAAVGPSPGAGVLPAAAQETGMAPWMWPAQGVHVARAEDEPFDGRSAAVTDTSMSDVNNRETDAELGRLDRLVGTWDVAGGAVGRVVYEWMDGGFFLIQRVRLEQDGQPVTGIELIGRERAFGGPPSEDVRSCFYDSAGNTLRYVYELEGDTLTIWGGEKGSPAYYRATFSKDGDRLSGSWVYPGGGYESTMTRVRTG
jgi:hypothetical protein